VEVTAGEPLNQLLEAAGKSSPSWKRSSDAVTSIDALAGALDAARMRRGRSALVFFDEFDAEAGSAPWDGSIGFLAPMQDGTFPLRETQKTLKKGVCLAGGTASLSRRSAAPTATQFVFAKDPDFVSRLRGHLDIAGINAERPDARLRRAAQCITCSKPIRERSIPT